MAHPTDFAVRSFNYRTLANEGARFGELANAAIALDYGGSSEEETAQARKLGLADVSTLPRTGFKGRQAIAWLRTQDIQIGDANNQVFAQADGTLIARLADTEAVVLGAISGNSERCTTLNDAWGAEQPARCFDVPRQDSSAWFLLTGAHVSEMFAKICGIDMRLDKFPNGSIAQTSIARMNAIAFRQDITDTPVFHLVFDSASATYLWGCLKDAMAEFDGAPVGHNAILAL